MSPAEHPETYQSVQALRGIAALLVTVFHAGLRIDTAQTTFRIGNAGVDIFFVISGFVIWTVTARRRVSPLTFLKHRFVRLVPLYWIMTAVMVAGVVAVPSAFPHMHATGSDVALSFAFLPHISPSTGAIEPVLGQGWTLNYEVFFYLVFAAVLLLPQAVWFPAMTAILLILPVIGVFVITPRVPTTTLLSPLLIEFLGGLWIARIASGTWRLPAAWCAIVIAAGVALLLIAAPAADDDWARVLQYGFPAFLIVAGGVGLEAARRLRVPAWVSLLGAASYSLYLTHTFAISLLWKVWPAALPAWAFIPVAAMLAVLIGVLTYLLLESPLLALMRRKSRVLVARLAPS